MNPTPPPGLLRYLGEETVNALGTAHIAFILSTVAPAEIAKQYYLSARRYDPVIAESDLPLPALAAHYYKLAWALHQAKLRRQGA